MKPLDELRERVKWYLSAGEENHFSRNIDKLFDAFEAAYPGLVDHTRRCCNCGAAWNADDDLMLGTWDRPGAMLADVAMVGPQIHTEDPRIQGTGGLWLCSACAEDIRPACAKVGKVTP